MPGRIPILEPYLPNNTVKLLVTSEAELRMLYAYLVIIPFLSACIGYSLAQGDNGIISWVVRIGAVTTWSILLVYVFRERFKWWQTKGDLFR